MKTLFDAGYLIRGAQGLAILLTTAAAPAFAAQIVQNVVNGKVESVDSHQITVNGTRYPLADNGLRSRIGEQDLIGKTVQLYLTAPAGTQGSQALGVAVPANGIKQ